MHTGLIFYPHKGIEMKLQLAGFAVLILAVLSFATAGVLLIAATGVLVPGWWIWVAIMLLLWCGFVTLAVAASIGQKATVAKELKHMTEGK